MAVTIVGTPSVQSNTHSNSDKTLTFPSTTYGADEILTVDVVASADPNQPSFGTPSGGGLTWTQIVTAAGSPETIATRSWWANTGAGGTYAVTQTTTRNGGSWLGTRGVLTRHSAAHLTAPVGQTDTHVTAFGATDADPLTTNTNLRLLNVLAGSMLRVAGTTWTLGAKTLSFDSSIADTESINAVETGEAGFAVFYSTSALAADDAEVRASMDVAGSTQSSWAATFYEIKQSSGAVPSRVTNLAGTPDNGQVVLTWTAPADNGSAITDYRVYYRKLT